VKLQARITNGPSNQDVHIWLRVVALAANHPRKNATHDISTPAVADDDGSMKLHKGRLGQLSADGLQWSRHLGLRKPCRQDEIAEMGERRRISSMFRARREGLNLMA
jgi:hypothetical protein